MDDKNKEDEKRRIMTPPPEWGDGGGSLESDGGWLGEDELAQSPSDEATTLSAPTDSGKKSPLTDNVDWFGSDGSDDNPPEAEKPAYDATDSATTGKSQGKAVFTLPDDEEGSGWLGSDLTTRRTPQPDDKPQEVANASRQNEAADSGDKKSVTDSLKADEGVAATDRQSSKAPPEVGPKAPSSAGGADSSTANSEPPAKASESLPPETLLTDHQLAQQNSRRLPVWPIAIVVAAAILLVIGGWGAIEERSTLQAQIAELEARLASQRQVGDLDSNEEGALREENDAMRAQLATLRAEYVRLAEEIKSLQNRLLSSVSGDDMAAGSSASSSATEVAATTEPSFAMAEEVTSTEADEVAGPVAAPAVERTEQSEAADASDNETSSGLWFVNVASHTNRDLASSWQERIREILPTVAIQEADIRGQTVYRVRVLDFESKSAADAARTLLENEFGIGPLWVGTLETTETTPTPVTEEDNVKSNEPAVTTEAAAATESPKQERAEVVSRSSSLQVEQRQPLELRPMKKEAGWFIYVDTFSQPAAADERAKQIKEAGFDAKVAVEYRSGEMFYRVQVVGITSRMQGEEVVAQLAALDDMPNLQLRQY